MTYELIFRNKAPAIAILFSLLLFVPGMQSVQANSLNRVTSFNLEDIGSNQLRPVSSAVLVDEQLYYINNERELWVTDGSMAGTSKVYSNAIPASLTGRDLLVLENQIFGLRLIDDQRVELWVTDAPSAETRRAIDIELSSGSSNLQFDRQGRILLQAASGNLVISDGTVQGTTELDVNIGAAASTVCLIDDNSFYFPVHGDDARRKLMLYRNGGVEEVGFSDGSFRLVSAAAHLASADFCYYIISESGLLRDQKLLQLDRDGSYRVINVGGVGFAVAKLSLFESNERVFVMDSANTNFGSTGSFALPINPGSNPINLVPPSFDRNVLYEINQQQAEAQRVVERFGFIHFIDDLIYVGRTAFSVIVPPEIVVETQIIVLDQDFQTIREFLVDPINNLAGVSITRLGSEEILIRNEDVSLVQSVLDDRLETQISIPDIRLNRVVTESDGTQQALYVFGSDRQNPGQLSLYRLQNKPNISERLSGTWVSQNLDSQGLVISTGRDDSGRRYLFTSLFVYQGGQAFWLAGNRFFEDGLGQLEVDLFRFSGPEFIEPNPNVQANSERVGQISITSLGCNKIQVELNLNLPFGHRDLEFERFADRTLEAICRD